MTEASPARLESEMAPAPFFFLCVLSLKVRAPQPTFNAASTKTGPLGTDVRNDPAVIVNEIGERAYEAISGVSKFLATTEIDKMPVDKALRAMQRDVDMLDQAVASKPKLSASSVLILGSTVFISATAPFLLTEKLVEFLVPSMSALCAAVGLSAEYRGKVEVARGKEIAAITLQAAAEAESFVAQAERAKAIVPLCVGFSATLSAFALLCPVFVAEVSRAFLIAPINEIYLICPTLAVLSAAVASLATQESIYLSSQAIGVGARRFASSSTVGRTWLSATEQIEVSSERSQLKWRSLVFTVLPSPLLAIIFPGPISLRATVAAASAAAQAAYSLAQVEYSLARAMDSVALKSRCAAVSDTYANQGARSGAILPFTSAISGFCAAVTVAVVELLPLMHSVPMQSATSVLFPGIGAIVAASASVSKARCEIDATAATEAARQIASTENSNEIRPELTVLELVRIVARPSLQRIRNICRAIVGKISSIMQRQPAGVKSM